MMEKRILLVDDQAHIVRILKRALTQNGYIVDTALNGVDALALLQEERYAAVVSDYQMPKMDGVELCEKFRLQDPTGNTLLILSTAVADHSLEEWANALVNTIYLEKPVSLKRLTDTLSEYLLDKSNNQDATGIV